MLLEPFTEVDELFILLAVRGELFLLEFFRVFDRADRFHRRSFDRLGNVRHRREIEGRNVPKGRRLFLSWCEEDKIVRRMAYDILICRRSDTGRIVWNGRIDWQ